MIYERRKKAILFKNCYMNKGALYSLFYYFIINILLQFNDQKALMSEKVHIEIIVKVKHTA